MKKTLQLITLLCAALAVSCSQEAFDSPIPEDRTLDIVEEAIGLDPNTEALTQSDAEIVALMFKNPEQRSRSTMENVVRNVVTIPGKDGKAALYAVNLSQGYVIVPATKALPPILAIVDDGTFSLDDEPFGRDVLVSQMVDEVEYWKTKGANPEYEKAWRAFNKRMPTNLAPMSREEPGTDVWYVQSDIMYELSLQNYSCYRLDRFEEEQEIVPDAVLQRFKQRARYEDNRWESEDEDMIYKTAFVAVKDYRNGGHSSNFYLLKTHWHQNNPYNCSLSTNRALGCVTVAVGQIMKYYKYPTRFNWSAMPDENDYDELRTPSVVSDFLKTIHDDLGIGEGTSSNINEAERVFKKYGYSVKQVGHKYGAYESFPTYCRGEDKSINKGHAWVCDGLADIYSGTVYELYILDCAYYPEFKFMKIDEELDQTSYRLYHMNWGWAGTKNQSGIIQYSDGFFYDDAMNVYTENYGLVHLNTSRKDLIISKP